MRLIDADKLVEDIVDKYCDNCAKCNGSCRYDELFALIDAQAKAYDVDKVVKQLIEGTFYADMNIGDRVIVNHGLIESKTAIEIVKGGSINGTN